MYLAQDVCKGGGEGGASIFQAKENRYINTDQLPLEAIKRR